MHTQSIEKYLLIYRTVLQEYHRQCSKGLLMPTSFQTVFEFHSVAMKLNRHAYLNEAPQRII